MKTPKQVTSLLVVVILQLFFGLGSAIANSGYLDSFIATYPASQSANNASCQLCHASSTAYLNAYGRAFAANNHSFAAIEGQDSDSDPTHSTNIAEITANAQPGWTPGANNTLYSRSTLAVYATNQNPPSIAGSLDPAGSAKQAPSLNPPGDQSVNVGETLTLNLSATDADQDQLTFSFGVTPSVQGVTLTPGATYGTATLTWTPTTAGSFAVTITVQDAGGASDTQNFTITVGPAVNHPPVLGRIHKYRLRAGQTLQFTVTAADPDGDQLVFSAAGLPQGATLTDNGNGKATFLWTPPAGTTGAFTVTITVTDTGQLTASQTVTIRVRAAAQRKK